LIANTVRVSNSTVNVVISVPTSAQIANGSFFLNANGDWSSAATSNVILIGSTTTGNAAITGSFTANVLIANTVRVSNSTVNVVISVATSAQIANGSFFLNANGYWSAAVITGTGLVNGFYMTSGTSAQLLDSYAISTRGAEYFISVIDNNANAYQATKILTMHNNVAAFSTEYGTILSNTSLGAFDANVAANATHVTLYITPTSANTSVNFTKVIF